MARSTHAMTADTPPCVAVAQAVATSTGKMAAGHVWGAASCTHMRSVRRPTARPAAGVEAPDPAASGAEAAAGTNPAETSPGSLAAAVPEASALPPDAPTSAPSSMPAAAERDIPASVV